MDPQSTFNYPMPDDPQDPAASGEPPSQDLPDDGGYKFDAPADQTTSVTDSQPAQVNYQSNSPSPAPTTAFSGLSGNELYCLSLLGYTPGNLVVGNSVYALGFIGGLASGIRTTIGGEIQQVTNMIAGGRKLSLQRLEQELSQLGAQGATGVTSDLVFHPGNIEFLSIGSSIYKQEGQSAATITSSSDGQEFFCQVDAGYMPIKFVFGNVAYSIGIGRSILGELKELVKGEVKQFSDIFNVTRNLALERIMLEAKNAGANSVVGIRTTILPFGPNGVQEMIMIGTASHNPKVESLAQSCGGVLTSDLTAEEMWNVTRLGYVPLKLILGTSVHSLGVVGGIRAAIRGYFKGEVTTLTQMIYGAREESLKKVQQQAAAVGADNVLGIKTYIYQLGGDVIEFLAIGTAVKRVSGIMTRSDQIPPQAIIRDKTTFVNTADQSYDVDLNQPSAGPNKNSPNLAHSDQPPPQ